MRTRQIGSVDGVREHVARAVRSGERVGFVPTMGALHDGHGELMKRARAECDTVVASIFVNPLQFDRPDDLERYPRTLDADLVLCDALGVDAVFVPSHALHLGSTRSGPHRSHGTQDHT